MSNQVNNTLEEIARFTGKAAGIIFRDLADISPPLTEAFRRGWREKMEANPAPQPASTSAPESA